jgi:hypothetical protein
MLLQIGVLIAGFYFLHATNMEVLSGNFFENLQAHPKLLSKSLYYPLKNLLKMFQLSRI